MSKSNGFLQLRRGVWEHVRDGRMTITQALAFIYICCEADTRTGIWKGSAKSLSGELGIPERTARDVLEKMEHGDYIRRFAVPGRHACYPIVVHKFLITDGEHNGEQVNAIESKSPVDLAYFSREQSVEDGVEHSAAQKRKRIKTEKKPSAKTAAPADPRHKPVFDSCFEAYRAHYGVAPTWGSREGNTLKRFLEEHASIPAEKVVRRYGNLLESSDRYHAEKHGSLCHLLGNFDTFADGPVLERINSNAKPRVSADERTRDNLRAAGLLN